MIRDTHGNPITTDIQTQIPPLPRGLDQEAYEFLNRQIDNKIGQALQNLSVRTNEQENADYRYMRQQKIYFGLGGVAVGLALAWGYRRWFADDDDDMGNDGGDNR